MAVIDVTGPNPYSVTIGRDLNEQIAQRAHDSGARQVAIIHQTPLADTAEQLRILIEKAGLEVTLAPVPDAENGKSLEVAGQLWDMLGGANFSRQDLVIGLGGGAATDLAGFVAAAWMRGIKVIQVPTTLLAMVDAAVGGKTGINTAAGKNLVGAFHEPDSVFIDLARLDTLAPEEFIAGSAEIIKTGFIADPVILEIYQRAGERGEQVPAEEVAELIERSVAVKAKVVSEDLKESHLREILNYGHTLGHAVEKREDYRWRHGNAVAVGMMFVAVLARNRGLIDASVVDLHRTILENVGLPTSYDADAFDELYEGMTHDKKNRDGRIRFVVLDGIGSTTRLEDATIEELKQAYTEISH